MDMADDKYNLKRKKKSQEYIDDSDDPEDTGERTKKARMAAESQPDNEMIALSAKRFVNVRMFKGKYLIDIREYWTDDDGERKPGKKGISLSVEQWEKLKNAIPEIDSKIAQ